MQTEVSTAPAVMAAIVTMLQGLRDTEDNPLNADTDEDHPAGKVQVTYGHPGDDTERESIWIANVQFGTDDESGTRTRKESYDVDLWVDIHRPELTAQDAMERAWAVLSAIQIALHTRPFPAGVPDGVYSLELRPRFARLGFDPLGKRWADAYAVVHVEAEK